MPATDGDHTVYSFGGFALDVARGTLTRDGVESRLRPKSYAVLRHLVEHAGRLVGKQQLLDAVWGSTVVTDGALTQCIVDIRRALGDAGQELLRTVPRQGFMLDAAVTVTSRPSRPAAPGAPPETEPTAPAPADHPAARSRSMAAALLGLLVLAVLAGWFIAHRASDSPPDVTEAPRATNSGNSVAVLRFLDLSPDGNQAYFADGLAEEILHLLAQSPELRVVARSSSFVFEPGAVDLARIAGELDVSYVLEGSVRRADEQLRITVQLIDTATLAHVWSHTYDRPVANVLDLQREVATDVAAAMRVTLAPAREPDSSGSVAAQEQFLLGRYLFHRRGPGDLERAEHHFEQAVELDPGHARAWTALAGTYFVRGWEELDDPAYRHEEQRLALERAIAIDPSLGEAYVRLGRYYWTMGDSQAANAAFERAERVAPDDPLVLATRAARAIDLGRLDEALALRRRILERDPLSGLYRSNHASVLLGAGRIEEALQEYARVEVLSPSVRNDVDTARGLVLLGRTGEARTRVQSMPAGPSRDQLLVLTGGSTTASAELARLRADPSLRAPLLLAEIDAYEGKRDAAFVQLATLVERAVDHEVAAERATLAMDLRLSPFLIPLRDDPRWEPLLEALGST
jgi:TolB-like protein/DNA-binding winged helix-turn-helix (wHTH) protein/Flp pilus assembly protein TadD